MPIRKINFILLTSLVIVLLIVTPINLDAQQNVYQPYPIIFIHGINSKMATWDYSKNELEIYFKEGVNYKYQQEDQKKYNRQNYFPDCDYQYINNGDIKAITFELKKSIDNAISSFSVSVPDDERKVIIVAHSMGGLVARALLKYDENGFAGEEKDYYKSKIDKIIFIGTPHLGAPIASVLWIYNKVTEEDLPALLDDDVNFYSQTTLTPFKFQQISPSTSNFDNRRMAILAEEQKIAKILRVPRIFGPYPNGIALEQLRLAGDVSCSYYIDSYGIEPIPIIKSITGTNTFLGKTPTDLATPPRSVFKVIRGINTEGINIRSWAIDKVIGKYENDFTFPVFNQETQSLTDCATGENRGDGIVTKASQDGIGSADYTVNAFHVGETTVVMDKNQGNKLLQAIDDKPVIERIFIQPGDRRMNHYVELPPTFNYIKVKIKDYLLADIEIVDMKVNGNSIDLSSFQDPESNTYKPYFKYGKDSEEGKDFLKERTDKNAPLYLEHDGKRTIFSYLTLEPGEFWVRIDTPYIYNVFVKVKNAAEKESTRETCFAYEAKNIYRRVRNTIGWTSDQLDPAAIREATYNSFLATAKDVIEVTHWTYESGGRYLPCDTVGGFDYFIDTSTDPTSYYYDVVISRCYSNWFAFRLNSSPEEIKSIKLYFDSYTYNNDQDFDILVCHDTSNIWPPTAASAADKLIFSYSSVTEGKMQLDIDPQDVGSNGYLVLQFKPDFDEYNLIPMPVPNNSEASCVYRYVRLYPPEYFRLEVELK